MGPFAISSIASGASNLLGNLFGIGSQQNLNRRSRAYQLKMYKMQRADNIKFWKMQNKYNSPAAQMNRLKAANLNPNLMYGHMSSDSASSLRAPSPGNWNPENPDYQSLGNTVGSSIGQMLTWRNYSERNKNLNAQTNLAKENAHMKSILALGEAIKNTGRITDNARNRIELKKANSLYDTQVQAQKSALKNLQADTKLKNQGFRQAVLNLSYTRLKMANTRLEKKRIQAQINDLKYSKKLKEADLMLRSKGMNYGDALWQRMLAQFLKINPNDFDMKRFLGRQFNVREGSLMDRIIN